MQNQIENIELKRVFMFSGQGSHYYNMGDDLYQNNLVFKQTLDELDHLASSLLGKSILDEIYRKDKRKSQSFSDTHLSHPAIFMIEFSLAEALKAEGVIPDIILSTSMGALAGVAAAGCLSKEAALEIAVYQALMLERYCEPGKMIAVIDSPEIYRENDVLLEHCSMAGINFSRHFVLTASDAVMEPVLNFLSNNITHQVLAVNTGFHSSIIDNAEAPFLEQVRQHSFTPAKIPMFCTMDSKFIYNVSAKYLWDAIRRPIEFKQSISQLEQAGQFEYIDIGPSGTLATFTRYNLSPQSQSTVQHIMSPRGASNFDFKSLVI